MSLGIRSAFPNQNDLVTASEMSSEDTAEQARAAEVVGNRKKKNKMSPRASTQ